MLMQQKQPPDAIVCASDRTAVGAMQWLHRMIRVPDDIAAPALITYLIWNSLFLR
jgi:DNA-binding LacI/PurR family transcriptional regulator